MINTETMNGLKLLVTAMLLVGGMGAVAAGLVYFGPSIVDLLSK